MSSAKTYIFNIYILSEQIRKRITSFKEYRTSEEFSKREKICEVFDCKLSFDLQPHMKRICMLIHYMYITFSPCFRTLTYHLHLRIAFPWNIIWPLQFCRGRMLTLHGALEASLNCALQNEEGKGGANEKLLGSVLCCQFVDYWFD